MRTTVGCFVVLAGLVVAPTPGWAQSARSPEISMSVPRLVNLSGEYRPADGSSALPLETVTLRIYSQASGGVPLWQETQTVAVDRYGLYNVVLGATEREGIPQNVFSSSEAQWLTVSFARDGGLEGARTKLTSVPYALRAADAETLGGRPASAYQLAVPMAPGAATSADVRAAVTGTSSNDAAGTSPQSSASIVEGARPKVVNTGAPGYISRYVSSADVGISDLYEINGYFGFNTTTPQDIIHSRFSNSDGTLTGLAVQNMGTGALSYSGMLFYDQNGAVAQFQGFGNVSHEYRINNVASSGSINFMLGGTSLFKIDSTNRVVVGNPATPQGGFSANQGVLEVSVPATGGRHGLFARKSQSDTFAAAIHVRDVSGITGPLFKSIAGYGDGSDVGFIGSVAIEAINATTDGTGIYASGNGAGYAGQFNGNVSVTGTLSKGAGSFKIDHPLDPEHKYLLHSFVESPDMMNVYNGNAILDDQGGAVIALPDWFQALNRDFRYQLTAVGAPGPNLYVAEKIAGNQFRIAGGTPGGEVSWQVTGIRQDPFANANRIPVELAKAPNEAGKYLHPKAYNKSEAMGITEALVTTTDAAAAQRPR